MLRGYLPESRYLQGWISQNFQANYFQNWKKVNSCQVQRVLSSKKHVMYIVDNVTLGIRYVNTAMYITL